MRNYSYKEATRVATTTRQVYLKVEKTEFKNIKEENFANYRWIENHSKIKKLTL